MFSSKKSSTPSEAPVSPSEVKGVYLWGGVGCGKTFIMDIFYNSLPASVPRRRVHFHEFMLEVHSRLHAKRKAGVRGEPLRHLAADIIAECNLLCFDEFQVGKGQRMWGDGWAVCGGGGGYVGASRAAWRQHVLSHDAGTTLEGCSLCVRV